MAVRQILVGYDIRFLTCLTVANVDLATFPRRQYPSTAMHTTQDSLNSFSFPSTRKSPVTPRHNATGSFNRSFKFPATPTTPSSELPLLPPKDLPRSQYQSTESLLAPGVTNIDLASPMEDSASNSEFEHVPPSRVLTAQILNGDTPRTSGEFYSLSNGTTEIVSTGYDSRTRSSSARPAHSRRQSLLGMNGSSRVPETLMMGYVQVAGSFIIDGSLIQSSPFEVVKRKGVVGGQMGGGVVGLEKSSRDSSFLGGLGWGTFSNGFSSGISNGIGGLLGTNNMSSIAEMKNIASEFLHSQPHL